MKAWPLARLANKSSTLGAGYWFDAQSHVPSHVQSHALSHVLSHVLSQAQSHVLSQAQSHARHMYRHMHSHMHCHMYCHMHSHMHVTCTVTSTVTMVVPRMIETPLLGLQDSERDRRSMFLVFMVPIIECSEVSSGANSDSGLGVEKLTIGKKTWGLLQNCRLDLLGLEAEVFCASTNVQGTRWSTTPTVLHRAIGKAMA